MGIDGTYKVVLTTAMGNEDIGLTLITDGKYLSGSMEGFFGQQSFHGGTISGNDISWTVDAQSPMGEMKIDITARVDGDKITGQVQIGTFRPSAFEGTRV